MQSFYSNGKLLLTSEYLVLDGANALAVPTTFGQSLNVDSVEGSKLKWTSFNHKDEIWFEDEFPIEKITPEYANPKSEISKRIIQILSAAKQINPNFLLQSTGAKTGYTITTKLDFPENWGLGSSSTLINNIASWSQVNPYELLHATFGGSGYDIACAQHNHPIIYGLNNDTSKVEEVIFNPSFKDQLFFIHLNKKQKSRDGIALYKQNTKDLTSAISEINDLTNQIIQCRNLSDFKEYINNHEQIISKLIKTEPVKKRLFHDYQGAAKSLGAWGGDFIIATGKLNDMNYFKSKGFTTILKYDDMVLNQKSALPK